MTPPERRARTLAAGYVVPLALAATAADHSSHPVAGDFVQDVGGITTYADDGSRWFFHGIGTYRAIKRAAAAMRAAMAPEESAALLVPEGLQHDSFRRVMHAMARERGALR